RIDLDRDGAKLGGQLAGTDAGDAPHATENAFAGGKAQREELEHGRQLLLNAGDAALGLRREGDVGDDEAADETDRGEGHDRCGKAARSDRDDQQEGTRTGT